MHLPTWDELNDEQRSVLEVPIGEDLFVAGPPGSGKTVLAVARARLVAEYRKSVALVTYNRMLRRLTSLLNEREVDSRTMHSFVWRDYVAKTSCEPACRAGTHDYDWDTILASLDGYQNGAHSLDHIVVDEGQDLPEGFFRYARRHAAIALTVFADDDQALTDLRTSLEQIKDAARLPDPRILRDNHRNSPEIAAVAEHFHAGRLPAATVRRPVTAQRPRLVYSPNPQETCERVATAFRNRGGTVGVVVRSNSTGLAVFKGLRDILPDGRVSHYTAARKNENSIALLKPGITVLNKESVKGQEFDTVFLLEVEELVPCRTEAMRRAMYMLCSRARDTLVLVHGRPLSASATGALPCELLLERG